MFFFCLKDFHSLLIFLVKLDLKATLFLWFFLLNLKIMGEGPKGGGGKIWKNLFYPVLAKKLQNFPPIFP